MPPSAQVAPHGSGPQALAIPPPPLTASTVDDVVSSASAASHTTQGNDFVAEVVVLTPRARVSLWLLLMTIVLANAALLVAFAITYEQYDTRNALMWVFRVFYLSYAGTVFVKHAAPIVAAGYAVLAVGFALFALQLLYTSAKMRGLHFGAQPTLSVATRRVSVNRTQSLVVVSRSVWAWMRRQVAAVRYLVGVRGPYFELRMLVDDIFELASQSAAAYASSKSISNVKLNLVYGVVIFLTSICPLVFRWIYKSSLVKQRMAGLVTDLVLDFVWGTLLPLWMVVPVVQVVTTTSVVDNFDVITSLTREIERVLILSWKNYALSVIPFIATLFNLIEIQSILREVRSSRTGLSDAQAGRGVTVLKLTYSVVPPRHGLLCRTIHFLLPLYGAVVLTAAIVATQGYVASPTSGVFECIHRVYPWFERDESCAGRRVNCSSAGLTGTAHELQHAFESFNARVLTDMLISDCMELTLPPQFGRFSHLQSIVVKNSYILQWGDDAAIGDLPRLRAINLNYVAFAEMPTGLVARQLTPQVEYIHLLEVANATQLLDAVGTNWATLRFFHCMGCELTEFHPAIKAMRLLSRLALVFNALASIPDDWTAHPETAQLDGIWLDANVALSSIADSFWHQTATCATFSIELTNISAVPDWLPDVADGWLQVSAANTPLCANAELIPPRVRPRILCETVY